MPEKAPSNRPPIIAPYIERDLPPAWKDGTPPYAELLVASNFSFLRGASHPEELAATAAALGLAGFSIADRNTLAGIVRGHLAAKTTGVRYAVGCRLAFRDGTPDIAVWPSDRAAYGRLCRLLTTGNLRAVKGECHLDLADLLEWGAGLEMAVLPPHRTNPLPLVGRGSPSASAEGWVRGLSPRSTSTISPPPAASRQPPPHKGEGGRQSQPSSLSSTLSALAEAFPGCVRIGAACLFYGDDARRFFEFSQLAEQYRTPLIALGDVLYHAPGRHRLQDVLSCVREHVTIENAGRLLRANGERHMKGAEEMARLFLNIPEAIDESVRLFERLAFSLDELRYEYPLESAGDSATPFDELVRLTFKGAADRYPQGLPANVAASIDHELKIIRELQYEAYFLTVWDIVRFARSQGILCQGRGSAANSAVCFCLGITEVDPARGNLLFERFISPERGEPPDIDVDFEHERREEVIQYIFKKYGREHAGLTATVITYRSRSAAREVGKAFGLSEDATGALAGNVWGWSSDGIGSGDARRAGLDPREFGVSQVIELSKEIIGFPRHLSQHVGGFLITRSRLDEVVPILHSAMEDRDIVEWDKDDLDALNMLKIDVLALGMLTAMKRSLDLLGSHYGKQLSLASIPSEDPATYDMICRADTIGVFQIESRAQMTMLPRLRPRTFYDLVIEVAIVRPGPIQGDMVHPYLRRRQKLEEPHYPSPAPPHDPDELKNVLQKTLGVPLFQEQAMKIAIVAAKFEPWEADKLRRAMATFKRVGTIGTFKAKMIEGMVGRGYERAFAERCFSQIEGFGEYGFPESHAASFALLVYASAWMKCHYPDVFCAGLLNAQPMGFYAPAQLVRDAREHGVDVREVDINYSSWDATLEPLKAGWGRGNEPKHSGVTSPLRGGRSLQGEAAANFGRGAGEVASGLPPPPCGGETERGKKHDERHTPSLASRHVEQASEIRTTHAVRLGFRQVKGLREADALLLIAARKNPYRSVRDLWLRSGMSHAGIERLAEADAFRSIGLDRRQALWEVRALDKSSAAERLPLFAAANAGDEIIREQMVELPKMELGEHVIDDYRALSLSLKAHPVSFLRTDLAASGIVESGRLPEIKSGRRISVAGLVLVRQRPGTASGVIFATLEDETGVANIIVWPKVFERFRTALLGSRLLKVTGRLQSEQNVIHIVAERLEDYSPLLAKLSERSLGSNAMAPTDEVRRPVDELRHVTKRSSPLSRLLASDPDLLDEIHAAHQAASVMPKGRNFQ